MTLVVEFVCELPNGVHARPASHVETLCNTFSCDIEWHNLRTDRKGNAKSALAIITLAPGLLEPVAENASYNCPVVPVAYIAPLHEIMCQERRAKSVSSVDLSKAKQIGRAHV